MEISIPSILAFSFAVALVAFAVGNAAKGAEQPDSFDGFWYFPGSHRLLDMRDLETIRFNQDFSGMVIVKKGGAEYVTNERADVDFAIGQLGLTPEDMA